MTLKKSAATKRHCKKCGVGCRQPAARKQKKLEDETREAEQPEAAEAKDEAEEDHRQARKARQATALQEPGKS